MPQSYPSVKKRMVPNLINLNVMKEIVRHVGQRTLRNILNVSYLLMKARELIIGRDGNLDKLELALVARILKGKFLHKSLER